MATYFPFGDKAIRWLQDHVVTESTQGSQHPVLCWVHHSQFQIHTGQPILDTEGLVVNAKWAGTIIIETEGMNEGLTDLLGRCGEQVSVVVLHASVGLSANLGKGGEGGCSICYMHRGDGHADWCFALSQPGNCCVSEKEHIL
ncbi:hypothetical protein K439DRAFT_1614184 [Ramaria rubella]|nr:hypothetical protein K439DRAFT_1614184 [Ramaria rubella]